MSVLEPGHCCSYCYVVNVVSFGTCGKCKKRSYCSKQCQKADWKTGSHKFFCTHAGELNHDIKVVPITNKGLGMVAMRSFEKYDLIIVERPLFSYTCDHKAAINFAILRDSERKALKTLSPKDGSISDKLDCNGFTMVHHDDHTKNNNMIFLNISRFNNACLGNAAMQYVPYYGVMVMIAGQTINVGEEITFNYSFPNVPKRNNNPGRGIDFDYHCECQACINPDFREKFDSLLIRDEEFVHHMHTENYSEAQRCGLEQLEIYDFLGVHPSHYHSLEDAIYQAFAGPFDVTNALFWLDKSIASERRPFLKIADNDKMDNIVSQMRYRELLINYMNKQR